MYLGKELKRLYVIPLQNEPQGADPKLPSPKPSRRVEPSTPQTVAPSSPTLITVASLQKSSEQCKESLPSIPQSPLILETT